MRRWDQVFSHVFPSAVHTWYGVRSTYSTLLKKNAAPSHMTFPKRFPPQSQSPILLVHGRSSLTEKSTNAEKKKEEKMTDY